MTATTATTQSSSSTRLRNRQGLLGLGLGNTLEWYDWMLFGLLSAFIGPHFFPDEDAVAATLSTLAIFAVGFAFRPLGGVLLGLAADRIGRRKIMLLSVTLMVITAVVIAATPTYAVIGVWASVILLVSRVIQGISTGIEAPLSTAYAVEITPDRSGRAAGIISFFVNLGILLASLISFGTSLAFGGEAMSSWGWRVPFVFGALMGLLVLYLRRKLPETLHADSGAAQSAGSVWKMVGKHWRAVLAMIFVIGAVQAFNYAWNVGLPSLARGAFGENPTWVFAVTTGLGLILLIGSPLTGALADRKRLSRTFVVSRLLAAPVVFLMLAYTGPGLGGFAAVVLGGGLVLVVNMTLYNVVATSLMPQACRATGVGLGYGIAVAVFGGTASYLLVWLQQLDLSWVFPAYVAVLSLISVVLYLRTRRIQGTYVGE